jgi:hypothetical protein
MGKSGRAKLVVLMLVLALAAGSNPTTTTLLNSKCTEEAFSSFVISLQPRDSW